jgi:hypothetical protein
MSTNLVEILNFYTKGKSIIRGSFPVSTQDQTSCPTDGDDVTSCGSSVNTDFISEDLTTKKRCDPCFVERVVNRFLSFWSKKIQRAIEQANSKGTPKPTSQGLNNGFTYLMQIMMKYPDCCEKIMERFMMLYKKSMETQEYLEIGFANVPDTEYELSDGSFSSNLYLVGYDFVAMLCSDGDSGGGGGETNTDATYYFNPFRVQLQIEQDNIWSLWLDLTNTYDPLIYGGPPYVNYYTNFKKKSYGSVINDYRYFNQNIGPIGLHGSLFGSTHPEWMNARYEEYMNVYLGDESKTKKPPMPKTLYMTVLKNSLNSTVFLRRKCNTTGVVAVDELGNGLTGFPQKVYFSVNASKEEFFDSGGNLKREKCNGIFNFTGSYYFPPYYMDEVNYEGAGFMNGTLNSSGTNWDIKGQEIGNWRGGNFIHTSYRICCDPNNCQNPTIVGPTASGTLSLNWCGYPVPVSTLYVNDVRGPGSVGDPIPPETLTPTLIGDTNYDQNLGYSYIGGFVESSGLLPWLPTSLYGPSYYNVGYTNINFGSVITNLTANYTLSEKIIKNGMSKYSKDYYIDKRF